jgi:non-ribosomal peptide synthetase component F
MNFNELLREVRETALEAYQYQDIPFERLVEELQPGRSLNRTPVFQVSFALQNAPWEPQELKGMEISPVGGADLRVRYDLEVHAWEREGRMGISWLYNRELFDRWRMEQMARHYVQVLEAVAADAGQAVGEIDLLAPEERRRVLYEWNETEVEYPKEKCIQELFEEQVEKSPAATAVVYENEQLTYRELNSRANRLAHYLRDLGVRPDGRVAICVERGLEMVVGLLGILKAGGAYVPLDPAYPVERLQYMLEDSGPVALLTQGHLKKLFDGTNESMPVLDLAEATSAWENYPESNLDGAAIGLTAEHLAYVIYTSGSTGTPKGVMVEHANLTNLLLGLEREIYQESRICERVGINAPVAFDASVQQLIQILSGRTLVIVPQEIRFDAEALLAFAAFQRIDALDCTPSQLGALLAGGLLRNEGYKPRVVLVGGEAIDLTAWRAYERCIAGKSGTDIEPWHAYR